MAYKNQDIKRTHDLIILVIDCAKFDVKFMDLMEYALELNPYISKSRYPGDCLFIPDLTSVDIAIKLAKKFIILFN